MEIPSSTIAAVPATILLVDHDGARLAAAARLLEEAGYRVVTGSNAAQAISRARSCRPELALIDAELADCGGLELAGQLKRDPQLAGLFVVLVSGERVRRVHGGAQGAGEPADGYLVRSCAEDDFLERLEAFLRIRSAQESLRESERRCRKLKEDLQEAQQFCGAVQEISKLGGWKCDLADGSSVWSDEVYRIYGVAKDFDFKDLSRAVSFYEPEDQAAIAQAFERAVTLGEPYDLELRFIRANGERIWVRTAGNPVTENGKVVQIVGNISDITGRKQVEEALRASEERYRAIVNAFDGVIYICSPDYRITFMNEELIRRRGNGVGEHCFKALHDLDEICSWCPNERVFRGEVVKLEVQSPKDGHWYYAINSPLRNSDGSISKQAMIHDITHLKQAEEQLKFKSFTLDNLSDAIFWLSSECRIVDVNQTACTRLGYSRAELLALSIADIDPDYPQHEEYRQHWEQLKRQGSLQFESTHRTREGKEFPVEIIMNYLTHNGQEFNCAIVREITERKNLEKALQASEELFRTLCDSAPIGIFRCDAAWNNIYCNPRWEEITAMSAAEGAGTGWQSAIHPDDREDLVRVRTEASAAGRGYTHEHRKLTPGGDAIWVRVLVNPVKGPGGVISGYVGTVEDVTEQRQARQEILKAQKLESIGVLAGGIAHDFNNILTAILGNISLARYQMREPEKVAKRLEEAEGAAARARDLTQQLLTFARGGEPVKKVVEVPGLLRESVAFALHGSQVSCSFDLPGDLWPLEADEGQLIQVIHNLVLNAVQATAPGGALTIRARNGGCGERGEQYVEISVSDTGTGIPEEHLERIFDPYFTTRQQGSGLGLASCYSIIKKHGGTIRAESTLGQGSTFHVVLPASRKPRTATASLGAEMAPGSSRVLVMDDEEIVRVLAKAILEQLGYQAVCVEDGAQAAEAYLEAMTAGTPFSAVILDLTIPGGVGGRDAIQMLLKMDPQVKAIVCSGYATDPVMANHRAYGFSAVLSKPYRPQDLSKVLQELLNK
jgi:two-component system, cell cycle sensor histidine kinase and response regulator CckA